jgi:hypothetical protein
LTIIYTNKPLPVRFKNDLYPTPVDFCRAALGTLNMNYDFGNVLDPGAGLGAWGKAVRELINVDDRFAKANLVGVEMDENTYPDGDYYDEWFVEDYLKWKTKMKFDLIIGNPPYRQAEEFVRKSFELLKPGGIVLFLLRLSFLEGQKRGADLWREHVPYSVHVVSRRISFTGNRRSDETAYALYRWEEPFSHFPQGEGYSYRARFPILNWLDWNYTGDVDSIEIGDLTVYRVIDRYFIEPTEGDIYYVEDYQSEGA